jgi:DNA-binding PadR family transcriptional regulator
MYPMTNASVYPALHELERDGFIEHDSEVHNGRARKVYRITDVGRSELRRWLSMSPDADSSIRDPLLLKVSMLDDEDLPDASAWLLDVADRIRSEIAETEVQLESASGGTGTRFAREYGLELLKLRLRLLDRVLTSTPAESPASASAG